MNFTNQRSRAAARFSFSTLLVTGLSLLGTEAKADFYIHTWNTHHESAHRLRLNVDALHYRTDSNYDLDGSSFTPVGLNSYQRTLLDLTGTFGLTSRLSLYGRLDLEISKVDSTTSPFNGSSSGLGDQSLGANYRIYEAPKGLAVDLQFQADLPAYGNTSAATQQTPFLGDGTTDLTGGAFITLPVADLADDDLLLVGGAGYTHRSDGFSSAVPYSAVLELNPRGEGFLGNLGGYGISSLSTDKSNSANLTNTTANSYGTGGSYASNAINPSLLSVRGEVGYLTANDLQFTASVMQSVWGKSAPNGLTLALGFQTHFGRTPASETSEQRKKPAFQSPDEYGRSNKGYVDYNLEAKVLKANDRFSLLKINRGSDDDVHVGDVFDIFLTKRNGTIGESVARGRVTDVKPTESAVKVEEYFKEIWIEEGFVARRVLQ